MSEFQEYDGLDLEGLESLDGFFDTIIGYAAKAVGGAVSAFTGGGKPKAPPAPTGPVTKIGVDAKGNAVAVTTQPDGSVSVMSMKAPLQWQLPVAIGVGALAVAVLGYALLAPRRSP